MESVGKLQELKKRLAEKDQILIAFSGGVDSSLLAKVATDVLGDGALCVILDSEAMPRSDLENAKSLAKSLGISLRIVKFSILDIPRFLENSPDRCYICKKESSKMLMDMAAQAGIDCVADGVNLSDCSDFRPGILASNEEGIWHPFVEVGITKEDVREIARKMGLAFWSKPSSACLSSRMPYGEQITKESLARVEEAEDYLKRLGLGQVRLRAHGKMARIEVLAQDMGKVLGSREQIVRKLKEIGYLYVALDLEGFRSGSMNELLQERPNESR
jgi:uncharacterized protein